MQPASSIPSKVEDRTLPGVGRPSPPAEKANGRALLGAAMKACAELLRHAEALGDQGLETKATKALEILMAGLFEKQSPEPPR